MQEWKRHINAYICGESDEVVKKIYNSNTVEEAVTM